MNHTLLHHRGFALLIAVIFMSVMLAFGLAIASLGYKQQVLSSSVVASEKAFYMADMSLECALYYDQRQNLFAYPPSDPGVNGAPSIPSCGSVQTSSVSYSVAPAKWTIKYRVQRGGAKLCADITIYKPAGAGTTYIFSQGYDVVCATVEALSGRFVSRGISTHYTGS